MSILSNDYLLICETLHNDQHFMIEAEARAIVELTSEFLEMDRADLLNLGCGTGNHCKYFQKDFNTVGVDSSEEVLTIARRKVPDVPFYHGDACITDMNKQFDVVAMMPTMLGHQHSNEDILKTLKNVRQHLRFGGLFIFNVWYGPSVLLERPASCLHEFDFNGVHLIRSMTPKLSTENSLVNCHYKWWAFADGKLETREEYHIQRYFFPLEVKLFLDIAGFELQRFGKSGYSYRPICDADRNAMFVAIAK